MKKYDFPTGLGSIIWSGERFLTGRSGEIEFEHYHRYLFAAQFCAGRDVLDIACGEGYGAVLLAADARTVVGVDIAADVIRSSQAIYRNNNLKFLEGTCDSIPLPDESIDVVVSFETIEHISNQIRFLAEAKRVLRPNGLLVLSTPERQIYSPEGAEPNPFHVRELSGDDLQELLSGVFANLRFGVQKATCGSIIVPSDGRLEAAQVFTRVAERTFKASPTPYDAPYLIALASDGELPHTEWGCLDDAGFLRALQYRVIDAEAHLQDVVRQLEAKVEQANAAEAHLQDVVRQLETKVEQANAAEARVRGDIRQLKAILCETDRAIAEQRVKLAAAEQQIAKIFASSSWRITRPLRVLKRALFEGAEGREELRRRLSRRAITEAADVALTRTDLLGEVVARTALGPTRLRSPGDNEDPLPVLLLVTHECSRTGAPMVCLNLLRELIRRGQYRVLCVALVGGELEGNFAALAPFYILDEARSGLPAAAALRSLLSHLQDRPVGAICNSIVSAPLVPVLRTFGLPVVSLVHELPASISHYGRQTIDTVREYSTAVVFGSEYVRSRVVDAFGPGTGTMHVIPTGYPHPLQTGVERSALRANLLRLTKAPQDTFFVLGCGSVDHRKGPDIFLQVAATVIRRHGVGRARFVWIGHKGNQFYDTLLEHDIEQLRLSEFVLFPGGADDVDSLVGGSDVFLLTSREDPYPLVNLAALGSGVPVVAFAGAGGAPEAIGTDAGIVVDYLDVSAMANAVVSLMDDGELCLRLGAAGRARFEADHTIADFAERIISLIPKSTMAECI